MVVEDERLVAWSACRDLERWGYEAKAAGTLADARITLGEFRPHAILLDIRLPDGRGLDLLGELPEENPPAVIVISAMGDVPTVVEAMRLGASDFLNKPFEPDDLNEALVRVRAVAGVTAEPPAEIEDLRNLGILSHDPRMLKLLDRIRCFAATPRSTVLMLGETGTGKSVAAKALHQLSDRASGPFVEINCAAVPETLIESELMGHERGAFTDARQSRRGLLEAADGGTLLLDEIGDMPLGMQAKLLRFIETRRYRRLGSNREATADVRIVTATHRDLYEAVNDGRFRADLYYRLKVLTAYIPPLRDRPQDVELLAEHFIDQLGADMGSAVTGLTRPAVALLQSHNWPGNVRELRHTIEAAIAISGGVRLLTPEHLRPVLGSGESHLQDKAPNIPGGAASPSEFDEFDPEIETLGTAGAGPVLRFVLDGSVTLADIEKHALSVALLHSEGNQVQAAKLLGVSRDLFRYRLKKFGLAE